MLRTGDRRQTATKGGGGCRKEARDRETAQKYKGKKTSSTEQYLSIPLSL